MVRPAPPTSTVTSCVHVLRSPWNAASTGDPRPGRRRKPTLYLAVSPHTVGRGGVRSGVAEIVVEQADQLGPCPLADS